MGPRAHARHSALHYSQIKACDGRKNGRREMPATSTELSRCTPPLKRARAPFSIVAAALECCISHSASGRCMT
eukprot:IDg10796t1